MTSFTRSFPLDDIAIRSGGDGRTVVAYAAVFDVETEISDFQGNYREVIDRTAFNKTLADNGKRLAVRCFYNHGMTIHGTPSEMDSLPIGTPEEIRVDGKGLLTVTRYNNTPRAEQVLEVIRSGGITGQSFSGRIIHSTPELRRGQLYRPSADGVLPTVRRTELGLREYGPTPLPAYDQDMVLSVRSLQAMTAAERAQLMVSLNLALDTDDDDAADAAEDAAAPSSDGTTGRSVAASQPEPPLALLTAAQRARIGRITRGI